MRTVPLFILLAPIFLWGCSSGGGASTSGSQRDPNRISLEELQDLPPGTAYDAVGRLRPAWLRGRSSTTGGGTGGGAQAARVFVDGREFGSVASLRDLHLDSVAEIRFMSARDATTRYGTGYPGGIILVRLKGNS